MSANLHDERRKVSTAELFARSLVLFTYIYVLFWLSLTSNPPQISGVLGWDKLQHAGAYGLLSLLIVQFFSCLFGSLSDKTWWYAGLAAVAYGALLEILQLVALTGRTAEWGDLFADAVGAFLSCVIFRQACLLYSRHYGHSGTQDG